VQRTVKLAGLDMRPESLREWVYVIRGLDDDGLLLAAEYARSQGLYDRAINTAERTVARHDFSLRYLIPYRDHFAAAAREQAVDPAILLGLARQESRFALDIVSSAGAMGLMQLMPPTARWVAKQLGRSDYVPTQIGDIGLNTQFGAFYFKYWLDRLERLPALAAAAYNAGPGRAQAWRVGAPLEGAIWVETIPFNETRDYVKKVLANTMFYARELDQPYVSLSARLGIVPPRAIGMAGGSAFAAQSN
jgi:soluble lytic murein transglycosylase